jgi:hypothetical protein
MRNLPPNKLQREPPIEGPDDDAEREHRVAADAEFGRRLKQALQRGTETAGGVLGSVPEPAGFFPWKFTRGLP